jgi:hypothetical protein
MSVGGLARGGGAVGTDEEDGAWEGLGGRELAAESRAAAAVAVEAAPGAQAVVYTGWDMLGVDAVACREIGRGKVDIEVEWNTKEAWPNALIRVGDGRI